MRRHLAGIAAIGAITVAVLATPASSAPPPGLASYAAGATSHALALDLALLDVELTVADTAAGVTSQGPSAAADGVALTTPLFESDPAPSAAPGGPATNSVCVQEIDLPQPIDLLELPIACIDTAAALVDGAPTATAASRELVLDVGSAVALQPVLEPLIGQVLGPIVTQLQALNPLITLADVLDALLGELLDPDASLVRITLAPGSSTTDVSELGVVAEAVSNGVVIEVLPSLGPLLTVTVGESVASVTRDPVTGAGTATTTPSLVDIEWGTVEVPAITVLGVLTLPQLTQDIEDALNGLLATLAESSPLACGEDGPLADVLCLDALDGDILDAAGAAAEGFDFGAGTIGARSDALHLELLAALEDGGAVSLDLASAVAAANAVPVQAPVVTTTTAAPTPAPPSLARTGGDGPAPAVLLGLLGVAVLGGLLVRRSATGA